MSTPILVVEDLALNLGDRLLWDRLSFTLAAGETLALVGASGAGKSLLLRALIGLLPPAARLTGVIRYHGVDLLAVPGDGWAGRRGGQIALIPQEPRPALSPLRPIGRQIADVLAAHQHLDRGARRARVLALLAEVGLGALADPWAIYPDQLSGGQCQRVVIAEALAGQPDLLLADEPTASLDPLTAQAILDLIGQAAGQRSLATLLVTHDHRLAARRADRVVELHDRRLRPGPDRAMLIPPLPSAPPVEPPAPRPLLVVEGLSRRFVSGRRRVTAVDRLSFTLDPGAALAVVGASGGGKSTLAALIARLIDPDHGRIFFDGLDLTAVPAAKAATAPWRVRVQMSFQDGGDSLDPRLTVSETLARPLARLRGLTGPAARQRIIALLDRLELPAALHDRRPHQLSGGQRARVGIGRALIVDPDLLILDEPTAALDPAVATALLDLLGDLRRDRRLTYLLITHDLDRAAALCPRTLVIEGGRIVEDRPTLDLFAAPAHPHTAALLAARPGLVTAPPPPG